MVRADGVTDALEAEVESRTGAAWIFDVDREGMAYGNMAACDFWRAQDLAALLDRDYSSDMSEATRSRLARLCTVLEKTPSVVEQWTFYPGSGDPRTVVLSTERVELSGRPGLLFSVVPAGQRSEESLRGLEAVRHTRALVTMLDGEAERILYANPAALAWYGPSGNDGAAWIERFADPEAGRSALRRLRAEGSVKLEGRFRSPRGVRWHELEARRSVDPVTGALAILVHEQNIEARKSVEADLRHVLADLERRVEARTRELAASRDFIETVVDAVDALVVVARDGVVTHANRSVVDMLGDVAGQSVWTVTGLQEPEEGDPAEVETEVDAPGGRRAVLWTCAPRDHPDAHLVMTGVDLTQKRSMQVRIEVADRLASLGTLAAGVAHELNNPLAVIRGNLEALRDFGNPQLDPSLANAIPESIEATDRAAGIVADLRDYTRSDEATASLALDVLVHHSARLAISALRGVDLRVDVSPEIWVQGVEGLLTQLLLNLIVNGAQATEGRGRIEVRGRRLHCPDGREEVEVVVEDDGVGMSPETARRAFDPFFTTKRLGAGTGLGLYVCQRIVDRHGGRIGIDSGPTGTRIYVVLPAGRAPRRPEPEVRTALAAPGQSRLLLVDDDRGILNSLTRLLRQYEVKVADSGAQALERIEAEQGGFDVVLCDLMMPGMSGLELYRRVKEERPALADRFIFVSGGVSGLSGLDPALDQLENPMLRKPVDLATLHAEIAKRLAAKG